MARKISRVACVIGTLFLAGIFATSTARADELVQYGSKNPGGNGTARAIGTTIDVDEVFSYHYTYPTSRYYWPGVTFSNGIFFQTGYQDRGSLSGCQSLEYFAWAFDGAGNVILSHGQSCVAIGAHYFTLSNVRSAGGGSYYWQARVGSTDIGPMIVSSSAFPLNRAGVVSEVSTSGSFATNPRISYVRYDPAVRFKFADGTWHDQAAGKVYRANGGNYATPCPPYRIGSGTFNTAVTADSGTITCKSDGSPLW